MNLPLGHRKESVADGARVLQDSCGLYRSRNQIDLGTAPGRLLFVKCELETSLPVEKRRFGIFDNHGYNIGPQKLDLGYITDQRFRRCLQWDDLDIGE